MKLKKLLAAVTSIALATSVLGSLSVSADDEIPVDYAEVQAYLPVFDMPVGTVEPIFEVISDEEMESIIYALDKEKAENPVLIPKRLKANRSANGYGSTYYRDNNMTAAQQKLYDDIVSAGEKFLTDTRDLTVTKTYTLLGSDGSQTTEICYVFDNISYTGLTSDEARNVLRAVYWSNPQFYFLVAVGYVTNSSIALCADDDFASAAVRQQFQTKINAVTNEWMTEINALSEDWEKEWLIARKLCDYITYNLKSPRDQTIAGALVDKECVCNGYAMAMAYFLNASGIDSFLVIGNGHAWNAANIDGTWYEVDVTWMDSSTTPRIGYYNADWFNKGRSTFETNDDGNSHNLSDDHSKTMFKIPDCSSDMFTKCADKEHNLENCLEFVQEESTCKDMGITYKYCVDCLALNAYYLPLADHDYIWKSDEEFHWEECKFDGCGTVKGEKEAHTLSDKYDSDATKHWHSCTNKNCEYQTDVGNHTYENQKCTVCDADYPDHDHEYDAGKVTKEASCKEEGVKTFTCTLCGITKTDVIPKLKHTEEILAAKAATCTKTGLTEGKKCSVCGEILTAQEEIPAKGHTPVASDRVEPTCTKDGMTSGTICKVCGDTITAVETLPALGHIWEDFSEVPATCTKEGTTAGRKCTRAGCGKTEGCEVIEKLPHKEVIDKAVAATCTETGLTEGKHCSVCNTVITKQTVIAVLGHELVTDKAVAATCTESGLTEGKHCSRCGEILTAQEEIPAKGHTPVVSGKVEPTCTKDGMTSGTICSVCETIIEATETIPALGHDWEDIAEVPATCTEEGTTAGKKCKREGCGETEGCEVMEKLPHTEVIDDAIAATCIKTGLTEGKHCIVCGTVTVEQTVTAALGHDWVTDEAVAATCTESGLTEGRHCSRCDEAVAQQTVDASGHDFADGVCTVCGTEEVADCEHIGGDLKKDETEHYKLCTLCFARIEAEAHGYGAFETVREATCTEAGIRTHSCETCGFVQTEVIPALGHSFANGKCTVCGADDPNYTAPAPEVPNNNNSSSVSTTTNYPVVVPFGYNVKTSEQIADEVSSIAEGDTTEIKLSGNTTLDKAVLEAFAGKDVTVTVRIPGGSYWTINGKDIEKSKKVNLGVRMNRKTISEDRIAELSDGKKTVQLSLKHKGEFGFRGILNVPVNKIYNGKYANLYYDNKGSFEFVGSSPVVNGIASFSFTHASDYVIVIDDYDYSEDVSSAAGVYGDEDNTNDGIYVAVISAVALIGTAAAVLKKRKSM